LLGFAGMGLWGAVGGVWLLLCRCAEKQEQHAPRTRVEAEEELAAEAEADQITA